MIGNYARQSNEDASQYSISRQLEANQEKANKLFPGVPNAGTQWSELRAEIGVRMSLYTLVPKIRREQRIRAAANEYVAMIWTTKYGETCIVG